MEDLNGLEAVFRRIAREEITRALSAAEQVANNAMQGIGGRKDVARGVLANVMERVARDVLANAHPALALEPEHTASTPSTEPVHTITTVPERSRATCTCHRHTHVMGHDDRCGAPFCYCLSPVRARAEHTDVHANTEAPRTCSVCEHGEHDQGKCTMHVYLRGVASPCPCLASRTVRAQASTRPNPMCTVCEHAPHGAGNCVAIVGQGTPFAAPCECGGQAAPCPVCEHAPHGAGECEKTIPYGEAAFQCTCGGQAEPVACACLAGHRKAVNGQCQMCGHKTHNPAGCTGRRSFE